MVKADAAINILRNRISSFRSQGGKEEKEIGSKLEEIRKQKQKIIESKLKNSDKRHDRYVLPIKSKLGNFTVTFSGYNTTRTPIEEKLCKKSEQIQKVRNDKVSELYKKLDDITLKINISGLDADTTQLLKNFIAELERLEN